MFLSYIVLILIIGAFVTLSGVARSIRFRIEEDRAAVLELRSSWASTRMLLGDMIINWNDGGAYREFMEYRQQFDRQLLLLEEEMEGRRYYRNRFLPLLQGLKSVWATADSHLDRVTDVVDDPAFQLVEDMVRRQPGLQRLNHLWVELVGRNTVQSRRLAYLIQRLVGEVEFFPIYGDTVERLMTELVAQADGLQQLIAGIETVGRIVFFVTFLSACLWLATHFSHSLSRPIIEVTERVNAFAGLTGEPVVEGAAGEGDEVALLSRTMDRMFAHYTDLAARAEQLARGEITDQEPHFPREGVVGRSLDEIAEYLHELASTSAWIRNGEYGLRIRERSDNDVITRNFNIMSAVIREKITTLQNMFEAVDEAVIVVDEDHRLLEANTRVYRLLGLGEAESRQEGSSQLIPETVLPRLMATARTGPEDVAEPHYTTISNIHGQEIPVKVSRRTLTTADGLGEQWMFLLTNESWKARAKREQERLRAQATVAELRALRAQINPHFFFNTLNTIAHLIETDPDRAVGTVQHLADLFRYTLTATKIDRVPLKDELHYVRKYLDIESIRYGDTLKITYEMDDSICSRSVPPMLLQPLVENAVRYGGDESGNIDLTIRGRSEQDDIVIEVIDRGCGGTDPEALFHGHGTGIRNVNHRFRTLFNRTIEVRRNIPAGIVVSLRIPGDAS
jgi:PAS domain S-box-containing protein